MPRESIRPGNADMHLVCDGGGYGQYQVYAYVNPGESGYIYLKTFEGGGNAPIPDEDFAGSYKGETTEYTGWSADPHEQFLYNTPISFPEGGFFSGTYAVRLELWLVPQAGGAERKLFEKYFNVRAVPVV